MSEYTRRLLRVGLVNILGLWVFFFSSIPAVFASDASLFLSPVTGMFTTGEPISLRIMAGTGGESVNAVEGVLHYDPKKIEILSIDRTSSILSSWTREPAFDNEKGELVFAGAMSGTSSFSGARGEILLLSLRGLRSEEARIEFESGSASAVRAADGTGGNLLSVLSNGLYVFSPKEESSDTQALPASLDDVNTGEVLGVSTGTPLLSSTTHPDQNAWYNSTSSTISWVVSQGVSGVRLSLDKKQSGHGTVYYPASKNTKEINDISDGIWFVHLTREWENGERDDANFRLQIDTLPPVNVEVSEHSRVSTDPNPILLINATDTLSGVAQYELVFDDGTPIVWVDDGTHEYHANAFTPGKHKVLVSAVDRAGNRSSAQLEFSVESIPAPQLSLVQGVKFREGDALEANVVGPSSAVVQLAISRGEGSPVLENLKLDGSGSGHFVSTFIPSPGEYSISATAMLDNGALSLPSEPLRVVVSSSLWGVLKRNPFIPVAIIALLLLFAGAWFFWVRTSSSEEEEGEYAEENSDEGEEYKIEEQSIPSRPKMVSGVIVLGDGPGRKSPKMRNSSLRIEQE